MIKVQYFLAVYDEDTGWTIGDEPFFPASKAFALAEKYCEIGWTVKVVEQLQRTVRTFEPVPLKVA